MTPIESQIEGIVDSILEDYRHGRAIDKLTPRCDPDKEIIIDMISKLMRIVFMLLGVMIVWRSFSWLRKDRNLKHRRLKRVKYRVCHGKRGRALTVVLVTLASDLHCKNYIGFFSKR